MDHMFTAHLYFILSSPDSQTDCMEPPKKVYWLFYVVCSDPLSIIAKLLRFVFPAALCVMLNCTRCTYTVHSVCVTERSAVLSWTNKNRQAQKAYIPSNGASHKYPAGLWVVDWRKAVSKIVLFAVKFYVVQNVSTREGYYECVLQERILLKLARYFNYRFLELGSLGHGLHSQYICTYIQYINVISKLITYIHSIFIHFRSKFNIFYTPNLSMMWSIIPAVPYSFPTDYSIYHTLQ